MKFFGLFDIIYYSTYMAFKEKRSNIPIYKSTMYLGTTNLNGFNWKPFKLVILLIVGFTRTFCQSSLPITSIKNDKPIIDSIAINQWINIGSEVAISNNGKYFMYDIVNHHTGNHTLIVQAIDGHWKKEFNDAKNGLFSGDSKLFIFQSRDTLFSVTLGTNAIHRKARISSFKKPEKGKGEWIAYQLNGNINELAVFNLINGTEKSFNNVLEYTFNDEGNLLLLKNSYKDEKDEILESLQVVELGSGKITTIWTSSLCPTSKCKIGSYSIDHERGQIAFIVQQGDNDTSIELDQKNNSIWYFRKGMENAIEKVSSNSPGLPQGLSINNSLRFSQDARYVYFELSREESKQHLAGESNLDRWNSVSLDVWSYTDTLLQSLRHYRPSTKVYTAVAYLGCDSNNTANSRDKIICLTSDYEEIRTYSPGGDFIIVAHNPVGDRFWLNEIYPQSIVTYWLVSLKDGSRKLIPTIGPTEFYFSPTGKYVVYWSDRKYIKYDLQTGKTYNLCAMIPEGLLSYRDEFVKGESNAYPTLPIGVAGWIGEEQLLVYDNYDIWLLNLTDNIPPVNCTNSFGRLHNIKFRLAYDLNLGYPLVNKNKEGILLVAFNMSNDFNGFFRMQIVKNKNPILLTMDPCTWDHQGRNILPLNSNEFDAGMVPLKARDADFWLVKHQTSTEAPNYFLTADFKEYRQLTNYQPQKEFNWLSAEMVTWKQLDGTAGKGILYKPENFDPNKKYPILFNYYEQLSHRLFEYPIPDFTHTNINIPWFVSHGYLVFTPDIYYQTGHIGESVVNTIVSAARYLSKFSWVDSAHMGVNGHSTGGFETNYLITHTHLFAAAVEGAGTSDFVSSSLQVAGRLSSHESLMGATLWQQPGLYLENSPILKIDQITTPVLIFHSKDDTAVPWEQGVELFIALHRLGKPCWLLQYDSQNHGNYGKSAEDYTIRLTQFFDHYLRGAPVPKWMKGISAHLNGIGAETELVQ